MDRRYSTQTSSRRKSCLACVKAKRRCDLQLPQCTRCCTRGLICNPPQTSTYSLECMESAQLPLPPLSFNLAFEYPLYTHTNSPTPTYQFDDLLGPTLAPPRNVYLSQDKLDSCVHYFKSYITNIAHHGRTPFISPHLYNNTLPPCLQDVFLICSTYLSKTAINESLIFATLTSKSNELLSKHQYCSIEDELASVQALIVYQVIRLFDGDIRQRGIAEAQFQILDAWVLHLRQRSEYEPPLSIQGSPYKKWLFIESVRRTVLMSIFLQGVYHAIKDGFCDKVPDMASLPVTVRGDLWEVKSEGEWMQATRGSQPDVLTYHEFVEVWDGHATGDCIEDFQKVLLVACIGEEGLKTRLVESLTKSVGWT